MKILDFVQSGGAGAHSARRQERLSAARGRTPSRIASGFVDRLRIRVLVWSRREDRALPRYAAIVRFSPLSVHGSHPRSVYSRPPFRRPKSRGDGAAAPRQETGLPAYYPVYLDLRGRRCVVVGGNDVAEEKLARLVDCGADIVVIGAEATERISDMAAPARSSGSGAATARETWTAHSSPSSPTPPTPP